tara:strand:+ start:108 stop:599 length:492 start_codon:yes stop_codon:yes gene_type:complete
MLDKHNRYISDENTGIEMLYKGVELSNAEFGNSTDIVKFQQFANDLDVNLLKILGDDDYDRINTYNIPEHYKSLDVKEYVRQLVSDGDSDQTGRVELELTMFEERNLFPVIQILIYIIETMRKHKLVWGVGRGSSVASYVLYLIGAHKVNSLTYNLDIEEFLK